MKFKGKNVGQRVQLKHDDIFGFRAGDVGTIKAVYEGAYTVHFDIARAGWSKKSLGIPNLHGLYVKPENLRKVQEESK